MIERAYGDAAEFSRPKSGLRQNGSGSLVGTLNSSCVSFAPAGATLPLFESAVFESSGDRIDSLTNGGYVVPEPGAFQLSLLGIGLLKLTALHRSRRQ